MHDGNTVTTHCSARWSRAGTRPRGVPIQVMPMPTLLQQRCLNHSFREAVARCPECKRYFCRECVTEHDDRLICAACLKKLSRPAAARRVRWAGLLLAGEFVVGILTA